jgi:hypothetical protein
VERCRVVDPELVEVRGVEIGGTRLAACHLLDEAGDQVRPGPAAVLAGGPA